MEKNGYGGKFITLSLNSIFPQLNVIMTHFLNLMLMDYLEGFCDRWKLIEHIYGRRGHI